MVMAQIYATCGMYGKAIEEIDYLLSLETKFTVHNIELEETFDPLRELPEYQRLMKKYALTPRS